MTFFDIFSNKSTKEKGKKESRIKIIIDNRERNSLVPSELTNLGFQIEFKQLEIADYLVNETAVERKTLSDLQSSIINKRIFSQLQNLKQYPNNLLIIEGADKDDKLFLHENAIRGFILSVFLDYQTPIIFTKNEKDTALYLSILAKRTPKKPLSLRQSITFKDKKEQIQFILEGFPGVGPATAKKLVEKFKSLKNIINATKSELQPILGKKTTDFKALIESNL